MEGNQEKKVLSISNITEMATFYQSCVYPDGAHPIQIKETRQAYLAGFYEALQVFRQMTPDILLAAEKELEEHFVKTCEENEKLH